MVAFAALALSVPNDPHAQPTRVEYVAYQRVRRALPDGTPDPNAADNAWVRTRTQWFLVVDTDTLPVDARGQVHVLVPGFRYGRYSKSEATGDPRGGLADAFHEVGAPEDGRNGVWVRNGEERGGYLAYTRPADQRTLHWTTRTIVDEVETHARGGVRATRTRTYAEWCVGTQSARKGEVCLPDRQPGATFEAGPHVQVDAPKFGYGPVAMPREDVPLG